MQHPATLHIAAAAYSADFDCRSDLAATLIPNEPSYVSTLTARIRDYWHCRHLPAFCHSFALPGHLERKLGCDAVAILHAGSFAKICLFEAKWPRAVSTQQAWDYLQGPSSHFSSQLGRQSAYAKAAAIFELFIVESAPGTARLGLDTWGATCLWHGEVLAYDALRTNTVWDQVDFWKLVTGVLRRDKNLWFSLRTVAECKYGSVLPVREGKVTLQGIAPAPAVTFPVVADLTSDLLAPVSDALGISHFLYLNLGLGVPWGGAA